MIFFNLYLIFDNSLKLIIKIKYIILSIIFLKLIYPNKKQKNY